MCPVIAQLCSRAMLIADLWKQLLESFFYMLDSTFGVYIRGGMSKSLTKIKIIKNIQVSLFKFFTYFFFLSDYLFFYRIEVDIKQKYTNPNIYDMYYVYILTRRPKHNKLNWKVIDNMTIHTRISLMNCEEIGDIHAQVRDLQVLPVLQVHLQ